MNEIKPRWLAPPTAAVDALRIVRPDLEPEASSVRVLQISRKATLFRVEISEGSHPAIVAKATRPDLGWTECLIYEDVLPFVSAPTPQYLGATHDPAGSINWLFLEDGGFYQMDAENQSHRVAAAVWLASAHCSLRADFRNRGLPDRGPEHYRTRLDSHRSAFGRSTREGKGLRSERQREIASNFEILDRFWPAIDRVSAMLPRSIVHGDFVAENIMIRRGPDDQQNALPIDWEKAGIGSPVIDLARVDADTYAESLDQGWAALDREQIEQLRLCAEFLRPLVHAWHRKPEKTLLRYQSRMLDAARQAGWKAEPIRFSPQRTRSHGPTETNKSLPLSRDSVVAAWDRLGAGKPPDQVELIKEKSRSVVYRLCGALADGTSVIAKGRRLHKTMAETAIYEQVLPKTDVANLRCFGHAVVDPGVMGFLFLEDAGEAEPDAGDATTSRLAGEWLAATHTRTSSMARPRIIPIHDLTRYAVYCEKALRNLLAAKHNPAMSAEQVSTVQRVMRMLELAQTIMDRMHPQVAEFPEGLAHGDFVTKNIRIRIRHGATEVLPFDWEAGGWGPPLPDLARLRYGFELSGWEAYKNRVLGESSLTENTLELGARLGRILRLIASIAWASASLSSPWVDKPMRNYIEVFEPQMAHAIETM